MCLKRPCVVAARLRRLLQHFKSASAAKALPHTNLALAAVTLSGMTYDRDAAPPLETTSTHVARKLLAHAAATLCAFFVLQSLSTRCLKPSLLTAARLAIKSRRSIATRARLSQDQNFSIGFRSGDLGGKPATGPQLQLLRMFDKTNTTTKTLHTHIPAQKVLSKASSYE